MYDCKRYRERLPGRRFYDTIANFCKVDVHLLEPRKVGEAVIAPVKIVHVKFEHHLYPARAHASSTDSSVNTVHYKPHPDQLEHMTEDEAVKDKDKNNSGKTGVKMYGYPPSSSSTVRLY